MKNVHLKIGVMAKEYRLKAGMTQRELANKLGYGSPQFVSLFESGRSKIPYETLGELVIILGIPDRKILKAIVDSFESDLISRVEAGKQYRLKTKS